MGTTQTTPVLSRQEAAIATGSTCLHAGVTDRVQRLLEAIRPTNPPRVTLDRAVLFTESFKASEGQPLVRRWAKAMDNFAQKVPVTIFDDELLVGHPNTWLGKWAIVYPELDGSIMPAGVEMFRKLKGKPGEVIVTDEDKRVIEEVLTPYWAGKDYGTAFHHELPEDTWFMLFGPDPKNALLWTAVVLATSPMRHSQNWTPDFTKIITRGVKGIREEAQAKLSELTDLRDVVTKKPFLDAVVITCDAMTRWSRRYAALAREMAAEEARAARKQELLEIAEVCEWVPENPARTFREALQAEWWGQLFNRIEQTSSAMGQGRVDQYLLPYYRQDLARHISSICRRRNRPRSSRELKSTCENRRKCRCRCGSGCHRCLVVRTRE